MANYTTTITNEGAALLASVIANQGTLTFNEFRFSENDYTGQESTLTEGTFLGVFITAGVAASVIDSTTIKASAQFDNSTITGNHDLYSIGIIGTDGNTTALIAVCTTTDPDVIREPLTGTSTYAFNVNLSVSDTSQITVVGTTAAVIYDIDVVDNLTSTATNKPLSANQGRLVADNLAANEESGAKNLAILDLGAIMPINTGGTWSGNVYSHRSVDFTVTDNGVSVSGTASGGAAFIDIPLSTLTNGKNYIANGISGGADETYQIKFLNSSLVVQSVSDLYDGERTFEKNPTNQNVEIYRIRVASGANVTTNIYPMLRDARIIDPTFAPYAETNLQLTRKTSGLSNENLLDNPFFTVNQRGFSSAIFQTGNVYTADRWLIIGQTNGGSVSLSSSGMKLSRTGESSPGYLTQFLEDLTLGKPYTLSVLFADGTIESRTGRINSTADSISFSLANGLGSARVYYFSGGSKWTVDVIVFAGSEFTIRAVKLEIGTVSTLANDVEPNYTTELIKCQRYFKVAFNDTWNTGIGVVMATDTIEFYYFSDIPMRVTPSVSTAGAITAIKIADGSEVAISSVEISLDINAKNGRINFKTSTTLAIRDLYILRMNNAKVVLSADL